MRLDRLCAALEEEAALNPLGRAIAHGQIARVTRQRFALGKLWHEQPELLNTEIGPPILVVGQMPAGTTRVHRLLAADPAHAPTRFCDSWHPLPPRGMLDTRPLWSGLALAGARLLDPWLDTLQPFGAARADEELGWLAAALDHCAYEAQWRIPSFTAFSEARDPAPVYREFARILRTDAAYCGNAARPRVMKVPQFAEDLPALLSQFPGARIVVARRETSEVVLSAASLVANQMTIQSDQVDFDWIEREWHRKIALRQVRVEKALAGHNGPLASVDFASLNADWEEAIRNTYAALDLELTPPALAKMRREMRSTQHGAYQLHGTDMNRFPKRSPGSAA